MNKAMEYLLLSTLSYVDFEDSDIGLTLKEIFEISDFDSKLKINGSLLNRDTSKYVAEFFKKEIEEWSVFYVDNRTEKYIKNRKKSTGYYSVAFKNEEKIVIAFRGSERYPIEDAYRDFIETDLLLGLGKRPKQFLDGVETYKKVLELNEGKEENIFLTGHSLGGAIAQYVVLTLDKEEYKVPITCTWNALGINKNGIFGIEDFIDFEKILMAIYDFDEREMEILLKLEKEYMDFLTKELRKLSYVKDRHTVKISYTTKVNFEVTDIMVNDFLKSSNLKKSLLNLNLSSKKELEDQEEFCKKLFDIPKLRESLLEAKEFIEKLTDNKIYDNTVLNFCHSKDLTISLFNHVGSLVQLDKDFKSKSLIEKRILKKFLLMTKSVKGYHFEDVFIPFLITIGENRGKFSRNLNIDYLASLIRKIIYLEQGVPHELLVFYYRSQKLDSFEKFKVKSLVKQAIERTQDELLYKEKVLEGLQKLEEADIDSLWEKLKEKLVSPYEAIDVYDTLIFKYSS